MFGNFNLNKNEYESKSLIKVVLLCSIKVFKASNTNKKFNFFILFNFFKLKRKNFLIQNLKLNNFFNFHFRVNLTMSAHLYPRK